MAGGWHPTSGTSEDRGEIQCPTASPELPYDYAALEPHYQAENLELHHSKHHTAYVAGANSTLERLEEARANADYGALVGLEKTLAFNISGHVLHSMFWEEPQPTRWRSA